METLDIWREFESSGFFDKMRRRLKDSEHKQPIKTLKELNINLLINHLREEINELKAASYLSDEELADVANMCAFVYARLKGFPL